MKKKIIAFIIVLSIAVTILPSIAFAENSRVNAAETDAEQKSWVVNNQSDENYISEKSAVLNLKESDEYRFYIDGEWFIAQEGLSDVYPYMYDKKVYYAKALLERVATQSDIDCGGNDTGWYYGDDFQPKVKAFKKAVGTNYANGRIEIDTWFWIKVYTG